MKGQVTISVLEKYTGNPNFVLSLARGLSVIEAFGDSPKGVTVAEVAARTQLSRAAVRRALITLELLGYAAQDGALYRLNSRVLRLGFSFLSSHSVASLAGPVLEEISTAIHESSSVGVMDNDEILYLARSATKRVMSVVLFPGSRLPAYCTSMGRVLLAAMEPAELAAYLTRVPLEAHTSKTITEQKGLEAALRRVRERGYSLVSEELELGLRSLAVPVMTGTGRVVAAINTGVQASRVSAKEMTERFLPVLREAANTLGRSLG